MNRVAILGLCLVFLGCSPPEFDRAAWAAAKGADPLNNPRGAMIDEAERAGVKVGATRVRVRELLGDPDSADAVTDLYELGIAPLYHDDQYLIINYDEHNAVTAVRVHTVG